MNQLAVPASIPASATPEGDGIIVGGGQVTVDAFIDFLCPFCRQFELSAGPALEAMVADGLIRLVQHPMAFLDEASTTRYSSRAAAASGCASDSGKFTEYAKSLFVNQPAEGGPGLDDEELAELARSVGLTGPAVTQCLLTGKYLDWPRYVTEKAMTRGVEATPTVFVDGVQVAPSPRAITAAVTAASPP